MRTVTATTHSIFRPHPHLANPLVTTSPDPTTMGRQKKRQKKPGSTSCHMPSSPTSSISSIPAQHPKPPKNKRSRMVAEGAVDSKEDKGASDVNVESVSSTKNLNGLQLTDKQELKKAQLTHSNGGSASYAYFETPQLADALDKHCQRMLAYPCKACGALIHWLTYKSSPTNLSKHVASCCQRERDAKENVKLSALGVTGTGDIDPHEIPQLCAIWCAQGARPFAALGEDAHQGILHPVVSKDLPKRRTVSTDIACSYTAVQAEFKETLRKHEGAMYLGLDAWQSPNGFNILGTVLYCLVEEEAGGFHLEAMPLDFVMLHQSHTGVYLAETVQLIVEKFGVKEKVILRPFGSRQKKQTTTAFLNGKQDSDFDEEDLEDPDNQIQMFTEDGPRDEDEDDNDTGNDHRDTVAFNLIDDNEIQLEDDDLNEMSDEGEVNHARGPWQSSELLLGS
ncbi:hypothetical protein Pst134EB_023697 [Puccinia striiformis f. sp. tritici]|nr:hypothetical protein Pst134EB_023697 [Puccinia striiformis f. sp. tritici]